MSIPNRYWFINLWGWGFAQIRGIGQASGWMALWKRWIFRQFYQWYIQTASFRQQSLQHKENPWVQICQNHQLQDGFHGKWTPISCFKGACVVGRPIFFFKFSSLAPGVPSIQLPGNARWWTQAGPNRIAALTHKMWQLTQRPNLQLPGSSLPIPSTSEEKNKQLVLWRKTVGIHWTPWKYDNIPWAHV